MRNYTKERSLSTIAALLMLAVFAVGVLGVLLGGGKVYRALTQRSAAAYDSRTCSQYLLSKLRQLPDANAVAVADFDGLQALQITQYVDGEAYVTRIYCYDGWLMELFSVAGGEFSPGDGERVLPATDLSITQQQDLLTLKITDGNGKCLQLHHSLRGGEGVQ